MRKMRQSDCYDHKRRTRKSLPTRGTRAHEYYERVWYWGDFLKSQVGLKMYSGVNWSESNIYGEGVFRLQQGEPRLRH